MAVNNVLAEIAEKSKDMGLILSVAGKERCDLAYAIIQTASAMHKKVLVIDNSMTHDLYMVFSREKSDGDMIDLGQIMVCRDCMVPEEDMREFALTVCYCGLSEDGRPKADIHILATGGEMTEVLALKHYAKEDSPYILIQRDRVNRKQTPATIAGKIGIKPVGNYVIALSSRDIGAYQALTLNGNSGLKGISEEMAAVVSDLMCNIFQVTPKKMKKYLH